MEALLLPLLLIVVFYFLLIRPQQRQRKQMQEMQQSLTVGSKVMTGSGLLATVVALDDDEVELEVAPGVTNRYVRRAIVNVLDGPESEVGDDVSDFESADAADQADVTGDVDRPAESSRANDTESR